MTQKLLRWAPHELSERQQERRLTLAPGFHRPVKSKTPSKMTTHVKIPECPGVFTNRLTMFAAWIVSSAIMASFTFDIHRRQERFQYVINDKPGRRNGVNLCFQTNIGSVCSTKMSASVFDYIVEKAHCQRVFDIFILAHHLERWYMFSIYAGLGYLLFAFYSI
ncbi:hypothetical protein LAZ67_18000738 [Cordylochernes scorpioides]|uniref:Uncharacterized protein n=1 Tax=Cordylochernes scorpioides TaxID=51811 RepID=A0ABY6LG19_9ARAC|nr:hypothetical protein LAZ67_18000738 [Cordylochernes scorpioides]